MSGAIQMFYSYAEKDQLLIDELDAHLSTMKRLNLISGWQRRDVLVGMEREQEIRRYLDNAQIILLLVTPDFMASDYCYSTEMLHALHRDESGEARIIPILLRPMDIQDAPFSHLQMLPRNRIAVTLWADRDEVFSHIASELRLVLQNGFKKPKEQWLDEGRILYKASRYEQALRAYEQALRIDSCLVHAHHYKGDTLYKLKRYQEAFLAYEQGTQFAPSAVLYEKQGNILFLLERFEEALDAYTHALHLDPDTASIPINRGNALARLKQHHLALLSYEEAIRLNTDDPVAHHNKGRTLFYLGRYEEAIVEFEEAIRLKPDLARAYEHMADALAKLNRSQEASSMYARARQIRQKK